MVAFVRATRRGGDESHGNADGPEGSDSRECHDGFITVTPLQADLTAHALVAPLAQALG